MASRSALSIIITLILVPLLAFLARMVTGDVRNESEQIISDYLKNILNTYLAPPKS